jgi:chromosome segregation ATPase
MSSTPSDGPGGQDAGEVLRLRGHLDAERRARESAEAERDQLRRKLGRAQQEIRDLRAKLQLTERELGEARARPDPRRRGAEPPGAIDDGPRTMW